MTDPALVAAVGRLPVLARLGPEDRARLLDNARLHRAADGERLLAQGAAADTVFLLIEGRVALRLTRGRRSALVDLLDPPALIGDSAAFGTAGEVAEARALGPARLICWPAAELRARIAGHFPLAAPLLALTSLRLRARIRQIAGLKLASTAQRLAGALAALAPAGEGAARLTLPCDKRLLAEMLGMTPESLSRALARLGALGVEARADGAVAVADLGRLRAFAEEGEAR